MNVGRKYICKFAPRIVSSHRECERELQTMILLTRLYIAGWKYCSAFYSNGNLYVILESNIVSNVLGHSHSTAGRVYRDESW